MQTPLCAAPALAFQISKKEIKPKSGFEPPKPPPGYVPGWQAFERIAGFFHQTRNYRLSLLSPDPERLHSIAASLGSFVEVDSLSFDCASQRKYWMFKDELELQRLRENANRKYIEKFHDRLEPAAQQAMLSSDEERFLLRFYELQMRDLCKRFMPPMPKVVIGSAFHYFKRFYLNNSVMDFHPKEILVTCVYLACKVEEFNVSIVQFVANIKGDREKAADIIINNELQLMQQLNYHLVVHNPFLPVEGFLLDIKVRSQLKDPEKLRGGIDELLDKLYLTDACLLYSPSQIALAAILHSTSKNQENLDAYVTQTLLGGDSSRLSDLIEAVRKIRMLCKVSEPPQREIVKHLEKRLELCRNEENNPDSQVYKERMLELLDEDEVRAVRQYAKAARTKSNNDSKVVHSSPLSAELS